MDAGFKKLASLKPNVLTIYTNQPQAENLLESGEASLMGGQFSSYTLIRAAAGSPVGLSAPKEGVFAMPSGICKVKDGPNRSGRGCLHQRLSEPGNPVHSGREILRTADQPERNDPARVRTAGRPFRPGLGLRQQEPRRLDRALEPGHGLNPRG